MLMVTERLKFGAALVKYGLIDEGTLKKALALQKKTGESLGYILVKNGFVSQSDLIRFLEDKLGVNHAKLDNWMVDEDVLKLLSEDFCRKYKVFPLMRVGNTLNLAMVDPFDTFVKETVEDMTGCIVKPLVTTISELERAINKYYASSGDRASYKEEGSRSSILGVKLDNKDYEVNDAPIVQLVDRIIKNAIKDEASDIHIEPDEKVLRVRYRLDGVLHEVLSLSKNLEAPVVSRIKIMSDIDIAEKRVPQDGRIMYELDGRKIDLRVSTFPTVDGEKVVIRILDKSKMVMKLEDLGFTPTVLERFNKVIRYPNGIILVTGPTGSGKSTTLYAALQKINSIDKNIVTIEDPVEYKIPLVNQSQVNPKAGYNFASGLRSILRQDPDVIMVGEIRDYETAEIAIRAALTGHLVFSTLHTNDAASAVTRLIDMGVEPFLVASSVVAIMAQRLVRKVCPHCKEEVKLSPKMLEQIKTVLPPNVDVSSLTFYRGRGCEICKGTGYLGRTCINELLIPDEKIREMIVDKVPATKIKLYARQKGMLTLREDGLLKVVEGTTTIEEVMRVTQRDED